MNGVIMGSYRKGILQLWYGCDDETIKMRREAIMGRVRRGGKDLSAAPCQGRGTGASVPAGLLPPFPRPSLRRQQRGAHSGLPSCGAYASQDTWSRYHRTKNELYKHR